jgi:diaminopimelate epimerase
VKFAKWHGIGNDFVMVADPADDIELTPEFVRAVCDRRFGVGADGVIRVAPGRNGAELTMDYRNSDGSVGEMCGNGIRCLALFARGESLADSSEMKVATGAGIKVVTIGDNNRVSVDMGPPIFSPREIPVAWKGTDALHAKFEVDGEVVEASCLSTGNPHAVVFVDDVGSVPVDTLGPSLEHHAAFPNGANVEFVDARFPDRLNVRVWERGSGQTLACGTGACAALVAARLVRDAAARCTVVLPGGELEVRWEGSLEAEAPIYLTGPAEQSFAGELDVESYR